MAFPSTLLSLAAAAGSNFLNLAFGGVTAMSTGLNAIITDLLAVETKIGIGTGTAPDATHKTLKATSANHSDWSYYGLVMLGQHGPLGSASATLDVSSIDQNFRALIISAQVRGTNASTSIAMVLRINNDSGANYDYQQEVAAATTVSTTESYGATSLGVGPAVAASSAAGLPSDLRVEIPNYAGTTFNKTLLARLGLKVGTTGGSMAIYSTAGFWRSTAAINRITLIPGAGNFDTGSVLTVWGVPIA